MDDWIIQIVSHLNTNRTKWSNTLKQFVGKLLTDCLSVFNHFVGLVLKGLSLSMTRLIPKSESQTAIVTQLTFQ